MKDDHERLSSVFVEAVGLPPEDRAAFLDAACAGDAALRVEIERMLAHDRDGFLEPSTVQCESRWSLGDAPDGEGGARPGARFGRYTIIGRIAQGGMGSVYEATQDRPRRTVALKVIRADVTSPALIRRFNHEVEALGRLHHRGIAQVFDAGTAETADGAVPYFAMELIHGSTVTEYAARRHLDFRERLELLWRVCDAVHHAHDKGVIHRDLKPSNILVDETGEPKILDFGVARVTNSDLEATTLLTGIGQLVGTLPYMSPEQVKADPDSLDRRSDVYALGVLAYELLTGVMPYDVRDKPVAEIARIILEDDPVRLSVHDEGLAGDVETIVQKALEKEMSRRYSTAADLAADIRRHLNDQPIKARTRTSFDQLVRFARRNRALVGGVVAVFVCLVAGLVATNQQRLRARAAEGDARQRQVEAETEAASAKAVSEFLASILSAADPQARGRDVRVIELLGDASNRVTDQFGARPRVEATLRLTLGTTYASLGDWESAEKELTRAREVAEHDEHADTRQLGEILLRLADLFIRRSESGPAYDLAERALDLANRHDDEIGRYRAYSILGVVRHLRHEYDAAVEVLELAVEGERSLRARGIASTLDSTLVELADVELVRGRPERAVELAMEAIAVAEADHPPRHPARLTAQLFLAKVRATLGDREGALDEYESLLERQRVVYGDDHPLVAKTLNEIGVLCGTGANVERAESALREALAIERREVRRGGLNALRSAINLAAVLSSFDRVEEAERLYRDLLDEFADHPNLSEAARAELLHSLATVLMIQDRYTEAAPYEREAFASLERAGSAYPSMRISILNNLAGIEMESGNVDEAERLFRELIDGARGAPWPALESLPGALRNLGSIVRRRGALAESEKLLREAIEIQVTYREGNHPSVTLNMHDLAWTVEQQGRVDEAEDIYRDCLRRRREAFEPHHPRIVETETCLAAMLVGEDRFEEAETVAREAVESARVSLPPGDSWRLRAFEILADAVSRQGRAQEAVTIVTEALVEAANDNFYRPRFEAILRRTTSAP